MSVLAGKMGGNATDGNGSSSSHAWRLEPQLTANARLVLERRYLKKDDSGKPVESPKELFVRVSRAIASAEKNYGLTDIEIESIAEHFYTMMAKLEFMPNSPTLMNAGRELGQLSACFVLPIGDSMEEIFDAVKYTALIHKCLVPETLVMTDSGCRMLGSIEPGTWIETHEGMDLVHSLHLNGKQETFRVETKEGYSVTGTALHRFLVRSEESGKVWKKIGELKAGDRLVMKLGGWLGGSTEALACDIGQLCEVGVDESVISANEDALRDFLRRAFTERGWIDSKGVISLDSGKEGLARDFQTMMFYLGIPVQRDGSRLTVCVPGGLSPGTTAISATRSTSRSWTMSGPR